MPVKSIVMLGNEELCKVCDPVSKKELELAKNTVADLHDTMFKFRKEYGWGRGIAAPQIGIMKRIIYIHFDRPLVLINPEVTYSSDEIMDLWDDCMSFPDLLVKLKRHVSCKAKFRDLNWNEHEMTFEGDMSELFQHEYDHLDGILAVSRAIDGKSFALASEFKKVRVLPSITPEH